MSAPDVKRPRPHVLRSGRIGVAVLRAVAEADPAGLTRADIDSVQRRFDAERALGVMRQLTDNLVLNHYLERGGRYGHYLFRLGPRASLALTRRDEAEVEPKKAAAAKPAPARAAPMPPLYWPAIARSVFEWRGPNGGSP